MTIRTVLLRAARLVALVTLLSLSVGVMPARAASTVDIAARALVGGRYEVGGWLAVSVTLVNQGAPTDGYITAETDTGVVRRYVDLPAGARKVVPLYVQPEAFQREVSVAYTEDAGTVRTTVPIRVLEQTSGHVAIVGDTTGTLRPQLASSGLGERPEPIAMGVADLPERPEPLAGLGAMVWVADSTALTTAQRSSIDRWLAEGGELIVVGGADWQTRASGFEDLLPLTTLEAIDATSLAALATWSGEERDALEPATVSTGPLRDDARSIVTADDGTVIGSLRQFGAGRVVLIGTDLAHESYRAWEGSPRLWDRLVPSTAIVDRFLGGGGLPEETASAMSTGLAALPSLQVPPGELLLLVIVGYILLIGPISYFVLRRVDRRELAWVTAPILIVTFSACSYGIGRTLKGSDVVLNQVAVVRTSPTGAALAQTYVGVFSPDRSTYDLSVDADALLGTLPVTSPDGGLTSNPGNVAVEQGRPAHLRDLSIGTFGFAAVEASGLVEVEPALTVSWTVRDGQMVGTVTNTSEVAVSDVAYISAGGGERIGDLAAGASIEFTLPTNNFNGSSASDQVYGFGGFSSASEEQLRVAQRRSVIDALVGYGGWVGVGMDAGASGGRGPYIIGWHDGEGPMPIELDGARAQRHTTTVEVLSVRPAVSLGAVTFPPHTMSVAVSDTEGDVGGGVEPGQTIINDGSATFTIGLPLEASGLAATSVDIIVGPDPSIVIGESGDFVGFWPPGFTVALKNPATSEWVELGDLSASSRFEIDDPATALSSTGLIEVRITGTSDPNFGQSSFFVSAQVSGVIDT